VINIYFIFIFVFVFFVVMEKKQDVAEEDGRGGEEEEEELLALHEVLPLEVMQHIMGMADPASVARAEGVCRAWRSACESPFVWEAVFRRHFSSRPSTTAKGIPPHRRLRRPFH
jgi:hypothetical protein